MVFFPRPMFVTGKPRDTLQNGRETTTGTFDALEYVRRSNAIANVAVSYWDDVAVSFPGDVAIARATREFFMRHRISLPPTSIVSLNLFAP